MVPQLNEASARHRQNGRRLSIAHEIRRDPIVICIPKRSTDDCQSTSFETLWALFGKSLSLPYPGKVHTYTPKESVFQS